MSLYDQYKTPATFTLILTEPPKPGQVDAQLKAVLAEYNKEPGPVFRIERKRYNAYLRSRFRHQHKGRVRRHVPKPFFGEELAIQAEMRVWPVSVVEHNAQTIPEPKLVSVTMGCGEVNHDLPSDPDLHRVTIQWNERYVGEEAEKMRAQREFLDTWAQFAKAAAPQPNHGPYPSAPESFDPTIPLGTPLTNSTPR